MPARHRTTSISHVPWRNICSKIIESAGGLLDPFGGAKNIENLGKSKTRNTTSNVNFGMIPMREEIASLIAEKLLASAETYRDQYMFPQGTDTCHFIVDDLLPVDDALNLFGSFNFLSPDWKTHSSIREKKSTNAKIDALPLIVSAVTDSFHTTEVMRAVEKITGIEELEADPTLYAGGLSFMAKGDFLNPHSDNSHDASRVRYRRLNLLYYVTPDWKTEFGGNFELWNKEVTEPITITSKFNRLVVMETTDSSFHSVSPVLIDGKRCCLSNYYFSKNSPKPFDYYHVTSFTGRPNQPFRRGIGVLDNFARGAISRLSGSSRGKDQARDAYE